MIKVSDRIGGFSLRTGSLILLWVTVIWSFFTAVNSATALKHHKVIDLLFDPLKFVSFINLAFAIVGFTTAIFGINGIQQNRAKYLTPYLYFLGSKVAHIIFLKLEAIFYPGTFPFGLTEEVENNEDTATGIFSFIMELLKQMYFCMVIRAYRI